MPTRAGNSKRWRAIAKSRGVHLFDMHSKNQGIVHIIGPELGITQPGQTIVCGDSHTSTHGAFGALAFGIGTSEIEHVLATQCLTQFKSKTMKVDIEGKRPRGVTAKDIILAVIGKIGIARRHRLRFRIYGRGGARTFDGRAHDDVQYVHRRRRAGGDGGAGRDDFCVPGRAAVCAAREGISGGGGVLEVACRRIAGAKYDDDDYFEVARFGADGYLGHESRDGDAGFRSRAGSGFVQ